MGVTVLSLFDGMSCGQQALKEMGVVVDNYFASEIDKNAIKIANTNFPNMVNIGDVTKITLDMIINMPKIDLLLGGSPCQGFSNNGIGLNFEDPRSKLFFEFVKVLRWVKEYNNKDVKFLLENVCMKKEWEKVITDNMGVEPIEINSKLLTAQNRPRLYWTNIKGVAMPVDANIKLEDVLEDIEFDYVEHEGIRFCKSIGENSRLLVKRIDGETRISQGTKKGYIVAEHGDGINISFALSKTRRGRVIKGKSSCLDTQCNLCVYVNNSIRRYTMNELEILQGLPVGYTNVDISDRARIKAIGNGWTIPIIKHILSSWKNESVVTSMDKVVLAKQEVEQLKWII